MEQEQKNTRPKGQMELWKIIVISLLAGLVGGLLAFGIWDHLSNSSEPGSNSLGTTKTSDINVNVSTQATKAYDKIKKAVVTVEAYSKDSSTSTLAELFGYESDSDSQSTATSEGSGVIYKKSGNTAFIVTNNHVISDASSYKIILYNGKTVTAKLVGKDAVTDLAVLKINAQNVSQVASFGDSNDIKVGETALAIGSPMGSAYASTLTQGIISAKNRTVTGSTGSTTVIQTDAAINSGNSGGALVNLAGQVIGINSMKLSGSSSSENASVEGMGFAIPSNEVVKVINELVKNGKITRPALGVGTVNVTDVSDDSKTSILKLPSSVENGVVVMTVQDDSPVKGIISKYDTIVSLGGKKVTDLTSLRSALYANKLNDTVEIQYYHNGKLKKENIKLTLKANSSNTTTSESQTQSEESYGDSY